IDNLASHSQSAVLKALAHYWADRDKDLLAVVKTLEDEVVRSDTLRRPVQRIVRRQLDRQVGAVIAGALTPYVFPIVQKAGKAGILEVEHGFSAERLSNVTSRWVTDQYADGGQPASEEIKILEQIASRSPIAKLSAVLAYWREQWASLKEALQRLDASSLE